MSLTCPNCEGDAKFCRKYGCGSEQEKRVYDQKNQMVFPYKDGEEVKDHQKIQIRNKRTGEWHDADSVFG